MKNITNVVEKRAGFSAMQSLVNGKMDKAFVLGFNSQDPGEPVVEDEKQQLAQLAEYKIGDDATYEMVETDEGDRWVHSWLLWSGKHKNGKEASTPVHLSAQVKNGKIVWLGIIVDNLPGYMMNPPMDSTPAQ